MNWSWTTKLGLDAGAWTGCTQRPFRQNTVGSRCPGRVYFSAQSLVLGVSSQCLSPVLFEKNRIHPLLVKSCQWHGMR